jgi:hypothetical protein
MSSDEDTTNGHDSRIAKAAVKEVFAILGVDVDNPEKVEEFRKDLRFGASMRRATDRGIIAMVVIVAAMVISAFGFGIIDLIKANHKI